MNELVLNEELLLGQGCHKKVYLHPQTANKCVKVIYNELGMKDITRELNYRKYRDDNNMPTTVIPQYFGEITTNLGKGYVFERICDYDGKTSLSLRDYVLNPEMMKANFADLVVLLQKLKRQIMADNLVTMGVTDENILVCRISPTAKRLYLITDLGTSDFIPITKIRFFAKKKIKRKWARLIQEISGEQKQFREKNNAPQTAPVIYDATTEGAYAELLQSLLDAI